MHHQPITWNRAALDSALLGKDPERDAIYRRMHRDSRAAALLETRRGSTPKGRASGARSAIAQLFSVAKSVA